VGGSRRLDSCQELLDLSCACRWIEPLFTCQARGHRGSPTSGRTLQMRPALRRRTGVGVHPRNSSSKTASPIPTVPRKLVSSCADTAIRFATCVLVGAVLRPFGALSSASDDFITARADGSPPSCSTVRDGSCVTRMTPMNRLAAVQPPLPSWVNRVVLTPADYFRSSPNFGHMGAPHQATLCATNGLMRSSKRSI
jgi:hypothetical protein